MQGDQFCHNTAGGRVACSPAVTSHMWPRLLVPGGCTYPIPYFHRPHQLRVPGRVAGEQGWDLGSIISAPCPWSPLQPTLPCTSTCFYAVSSLPGCGLSAYHEGPQWSHPREIFPELGTGLSLRKYSSILAFSPRGLGPPHGGNFQELTAVFPQPHMSPGLPYAVG